MKFSLGPFDRISQNKQCYFCCVVSLCLLGRAGCPLPTLPVWFACSDGWACAMADQCEKYVTQLNLKIPVDLTEWIDWNLNEFTWEEIRLLIENGSSDKSRDGGWWEWEACAVCVPVICSSVLPAAWSPAAWAELLTDMKWAQRTLSCQQPLTWSGDNSC